MAGHGRFHFKNAEDLLAKADELGLEIPFSEDISPLLEKAKVAGRTVPNRLAVLPMEGADADGAGAPTDWTLRRYRRYAAGGSGLVWFEATAVRRDGRSNPHQLMISDETEDAFKGLVEETLREARRAWGPDHRPLLVLQLTHSGRFARPEGRPRPRIVHRSPELDVLHGLPADYPVLSDEALDEIQDDFLNAADIAVSAGFDGVDIKACHGYLVSELLAAHTRRDSRFGGTFENRSRFLLETVRRIREESPGLLVTSRLSAADMVPFPYGFGMDPEETGKPDLTEPKRILARLGLAGARLIAPSLGVPAWRAHHGRPFDKPLPGGELPDEHPLEGVARHLTSAAELQESLPGIALVGSGYSWLRRFFPNVGAAMVGAGKAAVVGQGRGALAYPDFARDLIDKGRLNPRKVCTSCSLCSHLLRQQKKAGCPVRDDAYRGSS